MSKLGHTAQFSLREYWTIMAYEVGSDDASGTDSNPALEDAFQTDLDMASVLLCKVVDQFHQGLWSARVDGLELLLSQDLFHDLRNLVLFAVGAVVCREYKLEPVLLALFEQPVFEQELACGSCSRYEGNVSSTKVNKQRDERYKTRATAHDQEFVMMAHCVWATVWSADPELVADLFLPESKANRPAFLDHYPRLAPSVDS